jgi:hypothetical protein
MSLYVARLLSCTLQVWWKRLRNFAESWIESAGFRRERPSKSSELTGGRLPATRVASDTSIEATLEPVKLFQGICKGGCDVGGRFAVQAFWLDEPSTSGRIPEGASQVARGLGVVVKTHSTGSVISCDPQPSESGSFMVTFGFASTRWLRSPAVFFAIGARHMNHAGTTEGVRLWAARRAAVSSAHSSSALVTQLHGLLSGSGMIGRTRATHGDPCAT